MSRSGVPPTRMSSGEFEESTVLDPIEATHVYAIVSSAIARLSLVGVIAVDPQAQAQELTQNVGEEISRMIAEQKALEDRFQQLIEHQHVLRLQARGPSSSHPGPSPHLLRISPLAILHTDQ